MKKTIIILVITLLIVALGVYLFFILPNSRKLDAVRNMPIENVNLENIDDGAYMGDYSYGSYTYVVEVFVKDHKIEKIDVVANRDTSHAQKAEAVIQSVLKEQSIDVDVISGATTTSKALLKAMENALK